MIIPRVGVLLAAYNGSAWIAEQLNSILNQKGVSVKVFVSVDLSDDSTIDIVESYKRLHTNIVVLSYGKKFGSAAANFYRLVKEVDFSDIDYIAFSDQDDIWSVDKLSRHTALIKEQNAEAVSSNVIAFWPYKSQKIICKSQPQKKWDFIFESAGPGCSFLMTPWLILKVRDQLQSELSVAKDVVLHDWLVYAICRANGRKWVIDSIPSLMYRQHENNVIGANVGAKAIHARFSMIKQGWYRLEATKVCEVCKSVCSDNQLEELYALLKTKTFVSQLQLLRFIPQARRKFFDIRLPFPNLCKFQIDCLF